MTSARAALSTVASSLDELTARVTTEADRYAGTERDDIASDLYEIERSLRAAARRLERLIDRLEP
jgi:hypothetical protein